MKGRQLYYHEAHAASHADSCGRHPDSYRWDSFTLRNTIRLIGSNSRLKTLNS